MLYELQDTLLIRQSGCLTLYTETSQILPYGLSSRFQPSLCEVGRVSSSLGFRRVFAGLTSMICVLREVGFFSSLLKSAFPFIQVSEARTSRDTQPLSAVLFSCSSVVTTLTP